MTKNSTYDFQYRLDALVKDMDLTFKRWGRLEPTNVEVANAIKSWKNTLENLQVFSEASGYRSVQDAVLALEDAWENRASRKDAIKSVGNAVDALRNKNRTPSVKSSDGNVSPMVESLKNRFIEEVRSQLDNLINAPQRHNMLVASNPAMIGQVYNSAARRVKAWMDYESPAQALMPFLTREGKRAVKAIDENINTIMEMSSSRGMDTAALRKVQGLIRKTYTLLNEIELKPQASPIKSHLFQELAQAQQRIEQMLPMIESGRYTQDDLIFNVGKTIEDTKNVVSSLPVKMLPPETLDCIDELSGALTAIVETRNPRVRIKALEIAAQDLSQIRADMEVVDSKVKAVLRDPFA